MISHLGLTNFKAWSGESVNCKLAPITLFLGANSTGKSSLIQSILMLKQTATSPDRSTHLNLGGDENDYVDLGGYDDVLSRGCKATRFSISLEASSPEEFNSSAIRFFAEYGRNTKDVPYVNELRLSREDLAVRVKRTSGAAYSVLTTNNKLSQKRDHAPERSIFLPRTTIRALDVDGREIEDISFAFHNILENISYLGPLRSKPKRHYTWNKNNPAMIGSNGEHAAAAILANVHNKKAKIEFVERISYWLNRMGVAERLEMKRLGTSTLYSIVVEKDGVSANLLDVGFGISQVLPVLTLAYFAEEGSTIILEEPEIHLHPLAQAILAELFVTVNKERNIQFIVETHSEHLFRRLQTQIAEKKLNAADYALYFVERAQADAVLRKLDVDEFGRVMNWPDKFFGDTVGELRRQTEIVVKSLSQSGRHHG